MRSGEARGDLGPAALFAIGAAVLGLGPVLEGRTYYWGDLTYIHYPWRSLVAEAVQRGVLPLWNPFCYLGMPLSAQMQCASWYPGSLPFYLFPFVPGLALYHLLHLFLAGMLAFLWLRKLGLGRAASAGGGCAYFLGGWTASRIPFLNHLSSLALFPALLLFADSPVLAGLSIALSFFSGYPPMLAGQLAAAFAVTVALDFLPAPVRRRIAAPKTLPRRAAGWAAAWVLAAALSSCLLAPAAELVGDSRRAKGVEAAEALTWSFAARDLRQFVGPPALSSQEFSPAVNWWKTSYAGVACLAASAAGLAALPTSLAAAAAGYLAAVVLLVLGANCPLSDWAWRHLTPLRYVRYPGNMAYLAAPVLALLTSAGLGRLRPRAAAAAAAVIFLELLIYASGSQPTVPKGYFADSGPLVRALRGDIGGHRYMSSGRALHDSSGTGSDIESASLDFKHRLYGLTNAPYRLAGATNFGEPLVPADSYRLMDFLLSRPGLPAAAPWLPWADVGVLLTRENLPAPSGLSYLGRALWHAYRVSGSSRAVWLPEAAGAALDAGLPASAPGRKGARPVAFSRPREDRFVVSGSGPRPGWVYLAEPRGPGWSAWSSGREVKTEPALAAFQKFRVPAGPWSVDFRYDPASWRIGLAVTIASALALAAYGLRLAGEATRR